MRGSMNAVAFLWVCVLGMACSVHAAGDPVLINELIAANSGYYVDREGEYEDWVELYNPGDAVVDLTAMCLTDDDKVPTQWRIPYGTKIAAKGYLVIWLDRDLDGHGLHASFALDAAGDQLLLYDADGTTLIDSVSFGRQRNNVSYGRSISEEGAWCFLMLPTPGALNTMGYDGAVADTKFDFDRGFYDEPFDVTITCNTPDAAIYYTLDGSEPGSPTGRLPNGRVYSGPIHITTTTCLRAQAIKDGWLPSNVDTQTYIFLNDAITCTQSEVLAKGYPDRWFGSYPADYEMDPEVYTDPAYADLMAGAMLSIPTVSLVTDKGNLFNRTSDPETGGIYIYTGHGSTGGQDWERPVSIEMFTADRTREFHVNCGVRIQGGENRNPEKCPKHGFGLRFRSEYGPSQFEFPCTRAAPSTRSSPSSCGASSTIPGFIGVRISGSVRSSSTTNGCTTPCSTWATRTPDGRCSFTCTSTAFTGVCMLSWKGRSRPITPRTTAATLRRSTPSTAAPPPTARPRLGTRREPS